MTSSAPAARPSATHFTTPAFAGEGAQPALTLAGSEPRWRRPSPVIVQQRAQAARRARLLTAALRISALLLTDLLVLVVAHDLLHYLRSPNGPSAQLMRFLLEVVPRGAFPRDQVLAAVLAGVATFRNYGTGPLRRHTRRLIAGSVLGLSVVIWVHVWDGVTPASLPGFILTLSTISLALIAGRRIADRIVRYLRPVPAATGRAIVIGHSAKAAALLRSGTLRTDSRIEVVGFVSPGHVKEDQALGTIGDLVWLLERHEIDTIMLAERPDDETLMRILEVAHRMGCTTFSAFLLYPAGGFVPCITHRGHVPHVEIRRVGLGDTELAVKRVFDTIVAAFLLGALSPVLAIAAIAVRATSRGPVLFRQQRIGYGGKVFSMFKFRSMVQDAEKLKQGLLAHSIYADERLFKMNNDPRITRVGRFLRRTSIDELPQLWNVLRGDMSLVGPRPPLTTEVARYEEQHYARFDMRPGITGPWQVSGRSNITSFDEIIAMDTGYLCDWSLTKDIRILFKTLPAVLSMKGAV